MATQIEARSLEEGKYDIAIGEAKMAYPDSPPALLRTLREAYRAGRADEAAIRAAALRGLMAGSPLG